MKMYKAINKKTGKVVKMRYNEDGTITKIDGDEEIEIKESTVKRHWILEEELIEKADPENQEEEQKVDKRKKFTDEQILEIRRLFKQGVKKSELARMFNASYSGIHWIVNGNVRKDLLGKEN